MVRDTVAVANLTGALRLLNELVLKTRIGDLHQCRDYLRITASAQVGDTIFGDHHISQMAGNGDVAVAPSNV